MKFIEHLKSKDFILGLWLGGIIISFLHMIIQFFSIVKYCVIHPDAIDFVMEHLPK